MFSKSDNGEKKKSGMPWVEKYRPKTLDDIEHQGHVIKSLKRTLQTANIPHLLFYGPPGTGKTSTILALARELYGPELMRTRVLELNASNERGISIVRTKIKAFAQLAVSSTKASGYPCPPYKIIILDEADSMTKDAQSALRRTMEIYSKVTRFCIICNYVSKIIDPITSRCAKFRYTSIPQSAIIGRLKNICTLENVNCPEETYNLLFQISGGDLRKAITILQTAKYIVGPGESLKSSCVMDVAGVIPQEIIEALLKDCKSNSFETIQIAASETINSGYPVDQILSQFIELLIRDSTIDDLCKAKISIRIGEADKKLIDGADEYLQLLDVLSFVSTSILGQ